MIEEIGRLLALLLEVDPILADALLSDLERGDLIASEGTEDLLHRLLARRLS